MLLTVALCHAEKTNNENALNVPWQQLDNIVTSVLSQASVTPNVKIEPVLSTNSGEHSIKTRKSMY